MKRRILTAAMLTPLFGVPTQAANHECYVPMRDWQSRTNAISFAEAQGWTVKRVRIDDGCYEIFAVSADGVDMEVRVNPATLEIITTERESFQQDESGPGSD